MNLRTLLLITIGLWLIIVAVFGYWRMVYAWQLGNGVKFFFHSLPLFAVSLFVVVVVEILAFRLKS
jgi:hypothetical protein